MKRVVVTGIGLVSPLGIGQVATWENLLAGKSGIAPIRRYDATGFHCSIAGEVPEYKISDHVPKSYRKATKVMARDIELAVIAADDAMKDAGLQTKAYADPSPIQSLRFGCNIGAGLISADLDELSSAMNIARGNGNDLDLGKWGTAGMGNLTPLWLLKYLPNMLACHVTIIHGLMGPSNTITCAEASSHLAIGEAYRTVQRGKAELAICGGAESRVNPMGQMRLQLLDRLNKTHNGSPTDALRPFDLDAAGSVTGEGGGLLVLEEYEHAKARGAKIYAELVGFGASQDATGPFEPDPTGHSYGRAIASALRDAKLNTSDVDLIVPQGQGVAKFDRAELNGLQTTFGDGLAKPFFAPVKAQIGNLVAGNGVDAATAVLSIATSKVAPAINTKSIGDAKLNVSATAREAKIDVAVTSTYSLGGQNAALVFRKVS
jgi:3-oxoacyl-[acyl-carrier-protein] synthase II